MKSTIAVVVGANSEVSRLSKHILRGELGISRGQLSRYEQGRSEIGAEILLRISRRSGKTIEWLLTGESRV